MHNLLLILLLSLSFVLSAACSKPGAQKTSMKSVEIGSPVSDDETCLPGAEEEPCE